MQKKNTAQQCIRSPFIDRSLPQSHFLFVVSFQISPSPPILSRHLNNIPKLIKKYFLYDKSAKISPLFFSKFIFHRVSSRLFHCIDNFSPPLSQKSLDQPDSSQIAKWRNRERTRKFPKIIAPRGFNLWRSDKRRNGRETVK